MLDLDEQTRQLGGFQDALDHGSYGDQLLATARAFAFGASLREETAQAIEGRLQGTPSTIAWRTALLGYYAQRAPSDRASLKSCVDHMVWLIEHAPHSIASGQIGTFLANIFITHRDTLERGKQIWLDALATFPDDPVVLGNASRFMATLDDSLSTEFLRRAAAAEPANPRWALELAYQYRNMSRRADAEQKRRWATLWLAEVQRARSLTTNVEEESALLADLAEAAYDACEYALAALCANEFLQRPGAAQSNGDAFHAAHTVLGHLALRSGALQEAERHLIDSVQPKHYHVVSAFGPKFSLAEEFLRRGENEVVLRYLESCAHFWVFGRDLLMRWTQQIRAGSLPNFAEIGVESESG
jgi:hypothetical protein